MQATPGAASASKCTQSSRGMAADLAPQIGSANRIVLARCRRDDARHSKKNGGRAERTIWEESLRLRGFAKYLLVLALLRCFLWDCRPFFLLYSVFLANSFSLFPLARKMPGDAQEMEGLRGCMASSRQRGLGKCASPHRSNPGYQLRSSAKLSRQQFSIWLLRFP